MVENKKTKQGELGVVTTPVIRRQRQKDHEFKVNIDYKVRPC
jgi:hypothetical protein